ncbi:MAG: hypothetical protein PHV16_03380, partial [Candidatus Nanoarchaeia archaeon]|nr:hypothetical protein [Candidatus Nanoarchaeia archaeon]
MKIKDKKTRLIIALLVLTALTAVMPIKEIITDPSIIGRSITFTKVFVTGLEINHSCSAFFYEGWNLISNPCATENKSIKFVLSSIEEDYWSVHGYNSYDENDPWKAYNPHLPSWVVNDLNEISEMQGYWINMKNQSNFHINGTLVQPNMIQLPEGWNLIGYPSNESKNITDALDTIEGSYDFVWMYNATDDVYYYFNSSSGNGTISEIEMYK